MPETFHVELEAGATLNRRQRRAKASDERRIRRRFVSINEACEYLGISRSYFYAHLYDRVRIVHIGGRSLVENDSLDELGDAIVAAG